MSGKKDKVRSRNWFFTLNNYGVGDIEYLRGLIGEGSVTYLVFQEEIGDSGTPHLQGVITGKTVMSQDRAKALISNRAHVEIPRNLQEAIEYCKKARTRVVGTAPIELGVRPDTPKEKGKKEKDRWAEAIRLTREGRLEEVHPQILVQNCKNLEHLENRFKAALRLENTFEQMLWFVGKTGTGKSRTARDMFPEAYIKNVSKWWDGYRMQEAVIIDEIQPANATTDLVSELKKWTDHYPFNAEVKGSSVMIRPKIIVVTSNYFPHEIFLREQDLQPMLRRFRVLEFENYGCEPIEHEWRGDVQDVTPGRVSVRTFIPSPMAKPDIKLTRQTAIQAIRNHKLTPAKGKPEVSQKKVKFTQPESGDEIDDVDSNGDEIDGDTLGSEDSDTEEVESSEEEDDPMESGFGDEF